MLSLNLIENCSWSAWTEGTCSNTCDGGLKTKTRTKITVESCGGFCEGSSSLKVQCNTHSCPSKPYLNLCCILYKEFGIILANCFIKVKILYSFII